MMIIFLKKEKENRKNKTKLKKMFKIKRKKIYIKKMILKFFNSNKEKETQQEK